MKIGSVVNSKLGGPLMTIENIVGDIADCIWFDSGVVFHGSFNVLNLQEWAKK